MENRNFAVKEKIGQLLAAGDWVAVADYFHPDFMVTIPADFPHGGVYRGVEGFRTFLMAARTYLRRDSVEDVRVYVADDNPDLLISELLWKGAVVATGAPVETTIMEFLGFKDGKLWRGKPHWFNPPHWS